MSATTAAVMSGKFQHAILAKYKQAAGQVGIAPLSSANEQASTADSADRSSAGSAISSSRHLVPGIQ